MCGEPNHVLGTRELNLQLYKVSLSWGWGDGDGEEREMVHFRALDS